MKSELHRGLGELGLRSPSYLVKLLFEFVQALSPEPSLRTAGFRIEGHAHPAR